MIIAGSGAAVLYGLFDPAEHPFFPKCPFLMLTGGFRCPGCGSQRAIHALLHLDLKGAFIHNPLVIISLPFLLLLSVAAITKESNPGFYNRINGSTTSKVLLALVLIWWVLRNIIGI